jgi:hypothetical protein
MNENSFETLTGNPATMPGGAEGGPPYAGFPVATSGGDFIELRPPAILATTIPCGLAVGGLCIALMLLSISDGGTILKYVALAVFVSDLVVAFLFNRYFRSRVVIAGDSGIIVKTMGSEKRALWSEVATHQGTHSASHPLILTSADGRTLIAIDASFGPRQAREHLNALVRAKSGDEQYL